MLLLHDNKTHSNYVTWLASLYRLLGKAGISGGAYLAAASNSDPEKNSASAEVPATESPVGRVVFYIDEHLSEQLSLEKMAEEAGLSKYQLIRRFHEEEGTTPWKFLMRKRVEGAKFLLENGVPPAQTAVEAGFYDQSHLNRVFRKKTGFTPKEYQKKNFISKN